MLSLDKVEKLYIVNNIYNLSIILFIFSVCTGLYISEIVQPFNPENRCINDFYNMKPCKYYI